MKIQSNLRAGMTFQQCDTERNYYKNMVRSGKCHGPANPPVGACHKVFNNAGKCLYKECPYPPFQLPC